MGFIRPSAGFLPSTVWPTRKALPHCQVCAALFRGESAALTPEILEAFPGSCGKKNVKNLGANFAKVGGSAKSVSSRLPQSFSFLNLVDLEECSQKAPFPNLKRAVKKTRRISWIETLRSHCYSVRLMK